MLWLVHQKCAEQGRVMVQYDYQYVTPVITIHPASIKIIKSTTTYFTTQDYRPAVEYMHILHIPRNSNRKFAYVPLYLSDKL
jgi:hypothetical protein